MKTIRLIFLTCTLNLFNLLQAAGFSFTWNTYATHQPILYEIAQRTSGPIVEFGCGEGSTDILHAICQKNKRLLISIDHDEEWVSKYTAKYLRDGYLPDNSGWHKFFVVPKNPGNTLLEDWILFLDQCELLKTTSFDLCFVDQHPGPARTETILRLKNQAKYIILHDCDMYVSGELGQQIKPLDQQNQEPGIYDFSQTFKYAKVYFPPKPWAGHTGPPTLLGSNFFDELPEINFQQYQN